MSAASTLAMPALAQASSFSPPGAPDTPTPPIVSLPALIGTPCVVVAHSLGTIVTYKLLRSEAAVRAPFYLTLGSPLAVAAVKNAIGPLFERPDPVSRWLNGLDADDPVTIGRALTNANFGPGIENIVDIDNGDKPHDIGMYLKDRGIAETLVKELRNI